MAKRKKRIIPSKKKKADGTDEVPEDEEVVPSAKKVAASSTSFIEDESSQCFLGIGTSEISEGTLGSSTHFWCNYCEFSADTKQELITHMRKHMIKCSYCTFSSLSRSEVNRHLKSEHSEEVEVESASSSTDHDMDKDPCCACVFCDFLTYSTEYLEKHTRVKHRGMLPKSVAKMISKSVSARIRQADAMFYSGFSSETADGTNIEKEKDAYKLESPSSSSTIVIDEERINSPPEEKPYLKDISKYSSIEDNSNSQVSSCFKPDHSEREAEKIINELSRVLASPIPAPSEWKVKVETLYCLSCPYSNVAIDKLKCHTFSRHPFEAAVARNNSLESPFTLPDVTLFCVKESCNHFTNTSNIYQEHLMKCIPLHESLPEEEKGRLKSTLKFVMEFDKKHSLKSVPRFIDYVSSFNKIHTHEESSKIASSELLGDKSDPLVMTENSSSFQAPKSQTLRNVNPASQNQNHSSGNGSGNSDSPNLTSNHIHTSGTLATQNNNTQVMVNFPNSYNTLPNQINTGHASIVNTNFPASSVGTQQASFQQTSILQQPVFNHSSYEDANKTQNMLPSVSHNTVSPQANYDPNQLNFTPASNAVQFNSDSVSGSQPPSAVQPQMSPNLKPTCTMNGNNFSHHSANPQLQLAGGNVTNSPGPLANPRGDIPDKTLPSSQVPFTPCQSAPAVPQTVPFNSNNQDISGQLNAPFAQPFHDPSVLSSPPIQQGTPNSHNQVSNVSAAPNMSNPQKMLDLLSDSYSVLMDDDLDLPGPTEFDTSQSTVPEVQGIQNQNLPGPNVLPETSFPGQAGSHIPEVIPHNQGMPYTFGSNSHQSSDFGSLPPLPPSSVPGHINQESMVSNNPPYNIPPHLAGPVNSSVPSSQNFVATQTLSLPSPPVPQYSNNQLPSSQSQTLTQPSVNGNPYPVSSPHLHFTNALSVPVNSLCQQPQVSDINTADNLQEQNPSPTLLSEHNSTSSHHAQNILQTNNSSQVPNASVTVGSSQSIPTFLESPSVTQSVQSPQGHEASTVPNFLGPPADKYGHQPNQGGINVLPSQDIQADQSVLQNPSLMANPSTPLKNQANSLVAKNVAGNSPLSPSIYLNGQAPRHNRSDWTNADMAPRGSSLPQIRQRAPAPMHYPGPRNIRQNLFPPTYFRGRGRPRGQRMPNRFSRPMSNPQDDDVIVTAVIRGPSPKQPPNNSVIRRGMVRGQRFPLPRGAMRGMMQHPQNRIPSLSQVSPAKKPFDVSRHFVDLACVVNSANEDENPGEDDIQIMGITPGQNAPKGPPKVVDAKKFSFCCVHCGKDQGSKQILKQHMKSIHNDSLLGALRNMETGQLLFFCPQLRCEFMTYDENRLTDHLYSCYSLDKSKQLPFDLHSALKNLRSLKIRNVNSNIAADGSLNNPIDLDGKGLRDTFNNNLTDAFDEMVENTIGRSMTRPISQTQLATNSVPSNYALSRPHVNMRPRRGRPILSNVRMPVMPPNQPRQSHMLHNSPNPQGNVRMPGYQHARMPGRRNFRQPLPSGAVRGAYAQQMPRSAPRGHPPSMRPVAPHPPLGNEEQPILIDIDPDTPEPPRTSQSMPIISSSFQSMESSSLPNEMDGDSVVVDAEAPLEQNHGPFSVPSDAPLPSSNQNNLSSASTIEESSNNFINSHTIPSTQSTNIDSPEESVEISRQPVNSENTTLEETHEAYTSTVPTQGDTILNNPNIQDSDSNGSQSVAASEFPAADSEEEQVNAILLSKVFAKVPHMPKKLSQRLVLRFKEFAAKRGVVITPNSKVIDEFVERISYKGSNPMSKQQQHQPPQHQQQEPQQQFQPQQYNQSTSGQQHHHCNLPATSNSINALSGDAGPISTENQSSSAEPIQTACGQNDVTESSTTHYQQTQLTLSSNPQSDVSSNQAAINAPLHQNQSEENNLPDQNESLEENTPSSNLSPTDESGDIIETKVILPERDLKFSGAFANLAKSVFDQGKKIQSPSLISAPPSPTHSHSAPTVSCNTVRRNSTSSFPPGSPNSQENSLDRSNYPNPSTVSLNEQVNINEKLLKQEHPIAFPSTREEDSILVESSVDHLVSGYASLEVDIAGTPLMGNNIFTDNLNDAGTIQAEQEGNHEGDSFQKDTVEQQQSLSSVPPMDSTITLVQKIDIKNYEMSVPDRQSVKSSDSILDKQSGKIVLKIKKGNIQRKRNDPITNVVSKADGEDTEQTDEQVVRRSERKRKIRQLDVEDDEVDELDELISDDDDEYQVESDDDSYDESEFKEHSSKKKKHSEDINAFNIKQKGLFYCWICYKKFIRCLGVKKHILQKHTKAFCALLKENDEQPETPVQLSLLLFCPKQCKYVTSNSDALSQHVTICQKSVFDSVDVDYEDVQQKFVTQEYVELQELIVTGAITELMNQHKSNSGKRKKQSKAKTSSPSSQNEEQDLSKTNISQQSP